MCACVPEAFTGSSPTLSGANTILRLLTKQAIAQCPSARTPYARELWQHSADIPDIGKTLNQPILRAKQAVQRGAKLAGSRYYCPSPSRIQTKVMDTCWSIKHYAGRHQSNTHVIS